MLYSIWTFIKRHRRKFFFAGVVAGGVVLLGRYAKKKFIEYQEKETAEYLAQFRRQHHFDSNQRNCNTTVLSLLPRLREALCHQLDSEALTAQLRTRPANKVEIWENLKIISFTRTIVAVYSSAMLTVYLRVQLNVLGGYMYRDGLSGQQPPAAAVTSSDVQKQYLAGVQYLFEQGLSDLIASVESAVRDVLGRMSLKDSVSDTNITDLIYDIRRRVEMPRQPQSGCNTGLSTNLCQFMVPPRDTGHDQACFLSQPEILTSRLVSETYDIVHSKDFQMVLTNCLNAGFSWLLGRIREYFKTDPSGVNGITSVDSCHSMPLAKVIPVANGMVHTLLANAPNPFIQELLLKDDVRNFALNVYSAFSEAQPGDGCGIN